MNTQLTSIINANTGAEIFEALGINYQDRGAIRKAPEAMAELIETLNREEKIALCNHFEGFNSDWGVDAEEMFDEDEYDELADEYGW